MVPGSRPDHGRAGKMKIKARLENIRVRDGAKGGLKEKGTSILDNCCVFENNGDVGISCTGTYGEAGQQANKL